MDKKVLRPKRATSESSITKETELCVPVSASTSESIKTCQSGPIFTTAVTGPTVSDVKTTTEVKTTTSTSSPSSPEQSANVVGENKLCATLTIGQLRELINCELHSFIEKVVDNKISKVNERIDTFEQSVSSKCETFTAQVTNFEGKTTTKLGEFEQKLSRNEENLSEQTARIIKTEQILQDREEKLNIAETTIQANLSEQTARIIRTEQLLQDREEKLDNAERMLQYQSDKLESLERRLEEQAERLRNVGAKEIDPLEDTSITLVASNVPESIFSAQTDAEAIVEELSLETPVRVIKACRLPNRSNKPALLKFSVSSRDEKQLILKHKKNIADSRRRELNKVWIRSSKTHAERVEEYNTRLLLKETGLEQTYYMTANGKLKQKTAPDQHEPRNNYRFGFGHPPWRHPLYRS